MTEIPQADLRLLLGAAQAWEDGRCDCPPGQPRPDCELARVLSAYGAEVKPNVTNGSEGASKIPDLGGGV